MPRAAIHARRATYLLRIAAHEVAQKLVFEQCAHWALEANAVTRLLSSLIIEHHVPVEVRIDDIILDGRVQDTCLLDFGAAAVRR